MSAQPADSSQSTALQAEMEESKAIESSKTAK
jgi:hypothetical protein